MRLRCVLAILVILDHTIVFRLIIPEVVLIQLSSWRWAQSCSKHVDASNKHIIEEIVRHVGHLPEEIVRHVGHLPEETVRHVGHLPEETVRHVGHLPELCEDARSEKYKI